MLKATHLLNGKARNQTQTAWLKKTILMYNIIQESMCWVPWESYELLWVIREEWKLPAEPMEKRLRFSWAHKDQYSLYLMGYLRLILWNFLWGFTRQTLSFAFFLACYHSNPITKKVLQSYSISPFHCEPFSKKFTFSIPCLLFRYQPSASWNLHALLYWNGSC